MTKTTATAQLRNRAGRTVTVTGVPAIIDSELGACMDLDQLAKLRKLALELPGTQRTITFQLLSKRAASPDPIAIHSPSPANRTKPRQASRRA